MTNSDLLKFEKIDLQPIKYLLSSPSGETKWPRERIELAERDYRRFLYLNYANTELSIVPTEDVDQFWHAHILDTKKYIDDCMNLFGEVLHHFPYKGQLGPEDEDSLQHDFLSTIELYQKTFGELPAGLESGGTICSSCSKCGRCNRSHDKTTRDELAARYDQL